MSMASYNLLKAAADGLADAINYRTNLKRRRREEEYNYNRDWQRNENEYQRDLGRKRDELDYMTDYDWKQQQRAHDRDIEWANQKREADKARLTDFFDTYNPANVNPYDRADVYNYNTKAIANGVDYLLKPEQSPEEALKEKEALLNLQLKFDRERAKDSFAKKKALIDYRNANRPKDTNRYKQLYDEAVKLSNETGRPIDESLMMLQGKYSNAPRAVKGGGNGAVMEEKGNWTPYTHYNDIKDPWNSVRVQKKEIDELLKSNGYENLVKPVYDALSVIQKEGATEEERKQALGMINEVTKKVDDNTATRMKNHLKDLSILVNYLNRRTRMMSGGKYGFGADEGFYDVAGKTAQIDSGLDSYIADEEGKANERNNIASNSMPVQTFNNPYDTRPKSIHIPFDEGLDPNQKRLYDKWNQTDKAGFYMAWDDNRRRR